MYPSASGEVGAGEEDEGYGFMYDEHEETPSPSSAAEQGDSGEENGGRRLLPGDGANEGDSLLSSEQSVKRLSLRNSPSVLAYTIRALGNAVYWTCLGLLGSAVMLVYEVFGQSDSRRTVPMVFIPLFAATVVVLFELALAWGRIFSALRGYKRAEFTPSESSSSSSGSASATSYEDEDVDSVFGRPRGRRVAGFFVRFTFQRQIILWCRDLGPRQGPVAHMALRNLRHATVAATLMLAFEILLCHRLQYYDGDTVKNGANVEAVGVLAPVWIAVMYGLINSVTQPRHGPISAACWLAFLAAVIMATLRLNGYSRFRYAEVAIALEAVVSIWISCTAYIILRWKQQVYELDPARRMAAWMYVVGFALTFFVIEFFARWGDGDTRFAKWAAGLLLAAEIFLLAAWYRVVQAELKDIFETQGAKLYFEKQIRGLQSSTGFWGSVFGPPDPTGVANWHFLAGSVKFVFPTHHFAPPTGTEQAYDSQYHQHDGRGFRRSSYDAAGGQYHYEEAAVERPSRASATFGVSEADRLPNSGASNGTGGDYPSLSQQAPPRPARPPPQQRPAHGGLGMDNDPAVVLGDETEATRLSLGRPNASEPRASRPAAKKRPQQQDVHSHHETHRGRHQHLPGSGEDSVDDGDDEREEEADTPFSARNARGQRAARGRVKATTGASTGAGAGAGTGGGAGAPEVMQLHPPPKQAPSEPRPGEIDPRAPTPVAVPNSLTRAQAMATQSRAQTALAASSPPADDTTPRKTAEDEHTAELATASAAASAARPLTTPPGQQQGRSGRAVPGLSRPTSSRYQTRQNRHGEAARLEQFQAQQFQRYVQQTAQQMQERQKRQQQQQQSPTKNKPATIPEHQSDTDDDER